MNLKEQLEIQKLYNQGLAVVEEEKDTIIKPKKRGRPKKAK